MARDKIEVDLLLNAKRAEATIKKMNRELDKMGKTMSRAFSGGPGAGGDKVRALGTGLSKATVRADEFTKSLEASNARVIAFGASAGLIMNVEKAMRAMVVSAIKVEKAMADVNVVMNVSTKRLEQFGKGMFKVAKDTAQNFDTVAEAATELARQGLGMEKTLMRTKDALILTRLTGMNAADSVKSLTAAVNSFNKAGVTSTQVINKMAKVDAAFAVSSEDLAKSISRVGSSAVDAGVSLDQLLAITTAVQQKTARGGAVIGNAFKTIFTRIQRTDVQQKLANIGVATQDMQGNMLDAVTVLRNLAGEFQNLSKQQQANIAENVAGVFQVNVLRAALSDLSSEYSNYGRALNTASTATTEAYQRNEQLNKSLDALVNRTLANLTQAGAALGGDLFGPTIEKILGLVNTTIDSFGKGGAMEGFGQTIGKGLIKGIGSFISGPGLVLATAVFGKLALSLGKFASQALKDIVGLNTATKQRAALEEVVVATIAKEPALLQRVKAGTLDVLTVEKQILNTIRQQQAERKALSGYGGALATSMYGRGARVGSSGRAFMRGGPGAAGGFVPNFANPNTERAAAAAGGYTAGAIKTMRQPGAGTMMYNSAETVRQFPGMAQKAIMPPKGSPAGAAYKSAFGAAHGFNPYAAGGFVPNFAPKSSPWATVSRKRGIGNKEATYTLPANDIGVLLGYDEKRTTTFDAPANVASLAGLRNTPIGKKLAKDKARVVLRGIRAKSFQSPSADATAEQLFANDLDSNLNRGMADLSKTMMKKMGIEGMPGRMGRLDPGTEGGIFEEAMRMSMKAAQATPGAAFDFENGGKPTDAMSRIFGVPITRIDAKRRLESAKGGEMPKKYFNDPVTKKTGIKLLTDLAAGKYGQFTKSAAAGFVPNFSPLSNSIGREMAAGVPASAIRVGSSSSLRGPGNPRGLGVYNTIDEPMGLNQGIRRSKNMGINPRGHGAAEGFVPNFMVPTRILNQPRPLGPYRPAQKKVDKATTETAENTGRMAKIMQGIRDRPEMASMGGFAAYTALTGSTSMMGDQIAAGGRIAANMGMMTMTGAALAGPAAPLGAAVGAAVGALSSIGDIMILFKDNTEQVAEALAKSTGIINESLGKILGAVDALGNYDSMTVEERMNKLMEIETERVEALNFLEKEAKKEGANPIFASLAADLKKTLPTAGAAIAKGNVSAEFLRGSRQQLSQIQGQTQAALGLQRFVNEEGGFAGLTKEEDTGRYRNLDFATEKIMKTVGDPNKKGQAQFLLNTLIGAKGGAEIATAPLTGVGPVTKMRGTTGLTELEAISKLVKDGKVQEGIGAFLALLENPAIGKGGLAKGFEKAFAFDRRFDVQEYKSGITDKTPLGRFSRKISDKSTVVGARFAFQSMFEQGGMYGPEMLEAARAATIKKDSGPGPDLGAAIRRSSRRGFSAQRMARGQARSSIDLKREAQAANRLAAQQMQYATAIARATKDTIGLSNETKKLADAEAERRFEQDMNIAKASKREAESKAFVSAQALRTSYLMDNNLGVSQQKSVSKAFDRVLTMSPKEMEDEVTRIRGIMGPKLPQDDFTLQLLESVLPNFRKIGEDFKTAGDNATNALTDSKNINKEKNEADKEALRLSRILNTEKQREIRITQAILSKQSVDDAKRRAKRGQMSAKDVARTYQGSIDDQIAAYGIGSVDVGGVMGQTFRNEMAYNQVDAFRDFRSGVQDVAGTMKSSFAQAFQSISTGATTVQGALANMAQSILNSINQMSSQIFANMMFSKMFAGNSPGAFAQGGYVRGYAGGGLVTGGSGYKDDVLTKMSGGEFVIKKSAVNKIGVGTLNAINGYANGGQAGPGMGAMGMLALGSGAASGIIGAAMADGPDKPIRMQNYGKGRNELGYLGGADIDAGQVDSMGGGPRSASTSLAKGFVYYTRDPKTGRLISERARPTEGRFEVSDSLSLMGRLSEGDPQTARMFEKEQRLSSYLDYVAGEKASRKAQIQAVKDQKRARTMGAFVNAAMLIGGAKLMSMGKPDSPAAIDVDFDPSTGASSSYPLGYGGTTGSFSATTGASHSYPSNYPGIGGNNANGGLAKVMGGEYIMSPQAVRTHGVGFMTELNRGNIPGYASGGLVGGGGGGSTVNNGGNTTNNVKINISIDKKGKAEVESGVTTAQASGSDRDDQGEAQSNAKFGEIIQGMVLEEIVKQQRPGGLLTN